MNEQGFTLMEGLLALALLGIVLAAVLQVFIGFSDVTTRNEERSGAISAAQRQMEATRQLDPSSLPTGGAAGPDYVTVGEREFEVVNRYCLLAEYCTANSRHVFVEVTYGGRVIYQTESVFTKLR